MSIWAVTAGVAFGATAFSKSLNASVKVLSRGDFSFYSDPAATQLITNIALPDVNPGGTSTFTVYVKNTSKSDEILTAGINNVPAATGTLGLTFDGLSTKTLPAGAISKLVGVLTAPTTATAATVNFAFAVDALPTGTPTTTGTTTTPPASNVSYSASVQSAFNSHCITCHGNSGGVNLTSYSAVMGSGVVTSGNAAGSRLYQSVTSGSMTGYGMSSAQVQSLADWINQGALNN
jgi:mono/diheme cytochrome c family protein